MKLSITPMIAMAQIITMAAVIGRVSSGWVIGIVMGFPSRDKRRNIAPERNGICANGRTTHGMDDG